MIGSHFDIISCAGLSRVLSGYVPSYLPNSLSGSVLNKDTIATLQTEFRITAESRTTILE